MFNKEFKMPQINKISVALTSALVTTILIALMFAGPGWETFFPMVYDLFVKIGENIQLPSS